MQQDGFYLLATHERQLTELADEVHSVNVHFQENLEASGMVFDYLLREGPARSRNALMVLEREGYPAEMVAAARARIQ
jgi:DNA mismatch repair ATPase MutS